MTTLAIDPGTTESAYIVWDGRMIRGGMMENAQLLAEIRGGLGASKDNAAIEMVASYGMPVGKETFETVLWIGRFYERLHEVVPTELIYRKDVKIHLCGSMKAKDGNIRQALIDKHGAPGTKKAPGKTYGISGHIWQALAVADYVQSKTI